MKGVDCEETRVLVELAGTTGGKVVRTDSRSIHMTPLCPSLWDQPDVV